MNNNSSNEAGLLALFLTSFVIGCCFYEISSLDDFQFSEFLEIISTPCVGGLL